MMGLSQQRVWRVSFRQLTALFVLCFSLLALSSVLASPAFAQPESPTEQNYEEPADPWQGFNRRIFGFNQFLDRWFLKPVAKGYRWVTPSFVDRGISNFFKNIADVPGLINAGLQGDFRQMGISTGRVLINTTVGIGGFIDVASDAGLERRPEDFGQTLAVWGVGAGPYVELPFLGGRHLRHAFSLVPEYYINPISYTESDVNLGLTALYYVDVRADLIAAESLLSGDRYSFIRDVYMQRRASTITNGAADPASDPFDDDFGDESFDDGF